MIFELLLGGTIFTSPPDGTWWQGKYPSELRTYSPSVSLGVRQGPVTIRAGYLMGGTSYCECDPSDERYGAGETTTDLSTFNGKGHMWSISGYYRWDWDEWYVQAGVAVLRSDWRVTVDNWYNLNYPDMPHKTIFVKHQGWSVSPDLVLGNKVSKNFAVEMRIVPRVGQGGEYTPMFRNPAISMNFVFSL